MKKLLLLIIVLALVSIAFADVIVGTGTSTQYTPMSTLWNYYRTAALYTAADISAGDGTITNLQWYCGTANATTPIPVKIYLKYTALAALTADTWVNLVAGTTQVFDASITANATGWFNFDITDFAYDGDLGNLMVLIETGSTPYVSPYVGWQYTTTATYKFLTANADGTIPASLAVSYSRPNIKLVGINVTIYPEPSNHVTGFSTGTLAYTSIPLNWTGAEGAQLPTGYLIQAKTAAGTYAPVADGTPVANDAVWTDGNFAINVAHSVGANTYTLTGLTPNTAYEVKIWPYTNSLADINFKTDGTIPTVNASTLDPTVSTFPWTVDFGSTGATFPPLNWSQLTGLINDPHTAGGSWYQDDFANVVTTPPNYSGRLNIWSTSTKYWLVTPPVAIPANHELKFDLAYTTYSGTVTPAPGAQADDRFVVLISDNPTMTGATILREWNNTGSPYVYDTISNVGENHIISLGSYTGTKYIAFYGESTASGGDNNVYVDNVTVRETPTSALFSLNPDVANWDFGQVVINTAATKTFTVSNTGAAPLTFSSIGVTGTYYSPDPAFDTSPIPAGGSRNFTVKYLPTAVGGPFNGSLDFNFTRETRSVILTGTCYDPTIALPWAENFTGIAAGNMPLGWFRTDTHWGVNASASAGGVSPELRFNWSPGATSTFRAVTPPLAGAAGVNYILSFKHMIDYFATPATYKVEASTNLVDWNTLWSSVDPIANVGPETLTLPLTGYTGTFFLSWTFDGYTYNTDNWYVDDITVTEVPTTPPDPVTLVAPANGATGVQVPGMVFDWEPALTGGVADYYEVYMSTDEDPINNNEFFWETTTQASMLNLADTGWVLADNQRYYWTVVGVSNTYGPGDYPSPFNFETAAETQFSGIVLNGAVSIDDIALNWVPYINDGTLNWDSGVNAQSIGLTGGGTFPVAARFTSPMLAPYAGQYVTTLSFYINDAAATINLKAWTGDDGSVGPNLEVFNQAVTNTGVGWYNITVPGIAIPATGSLWLGYEVTHLTGTFPAGCDGGPAMDYYGDIIYINGGWSSLHVLVPSLNYNWNIKGTITPSPAGKGVATLLSIPVVNREINKTNRAELAASVSNTNAQATNRYLHGYNVYRNNVLITPAPIYARTYADIDLAAGNYTYRVEAVYTATTIASNNWSGEVIYVPPFNLPFFEGWDSGNYTANGWATTAVNWVIGTAYGEPAPCAMFSWNPQITNYTEYLTSFNLNGVGQTNVTLSFELALNNYSDTAENLMAVEVWNGTTWNNLVTLSSLDYLDFGSYTFEYFNYDISAYAAGNEFKIRFVAYGEDSYEINQWLLDNINIYGMPAALAVPTVTISLDAPDVLVEWTAVPNATWYGIYSAADPYGTYTYLGWLPATYIGAYFAPGVAEFYKVTAGAGPLPIRGMLTNGIRK